MLAQDPRVQSHYTTLLERLAHDTDDFDLVCRVYEHMRTLHLQPHHYDLLWQSTRHNSAYMRQLAALYDQSKDVEGILSLWNHMEQQSVDATVYRCLVRVLTWHNQFDVAFRVLGKWILHGDYIPYTDIYTLLQATRENYGKGEVERVKARLMIRVRMAGKSHTDDICARIAGIKTRARPSRDTSLREAAEQLLAWPSRHTQHAILLLLAKQLELPLAERLLDVMCRHGTHPIPSSSYQALLLAYTKATNPSLAIGRYHRLIQHHHMELHPNTTKFIVRLYIQHAEAHDSFDMYRILSHYLPNVFDWLDCLSTALMVKRLESSRMISQATLVYKDAVAHMHSLKTQSSWTDMDKEWQSKRHGLLFTYALGMYARHGMTLQARGVLGDMQALSVQLQPTHIKSPSSLVYAMQHTDGFEQRWALWQQGKHLGILSAQAFALLVNRVPNHYDYGPCELTMSEFHQAIQQLDHIQIPTESDTSPIAQQLYNEWTALREVGIADARNARQLIGALCRLSSPRLALIVYHWMNQQRTNLNLPIDDPTWGTRPWTVHHLHSFFIHDN
jgi:hypothetical protein